MDFLGVDLSNKDGDAQINREIDECVIDFLKDFELEGKSRKPCMFLLRCSVQWKWANAF